MENPETWGEAEHVIRRVLNEDERAKLSPDPIIGWSLPKRIAEALREASLLIPAGKTG